MRVQLRPALSTVTVSSLVPVAKSAIALRRPRPKCYGRVVVTSITATRQNQEYTLRMWFWRKFVSASIVLAVLSVPLMSLANCASGPASSMQCTPDCVMMASMNSGHHEMASMRSGHHEMQMKSELSGSCCTIKGSRPAPVTESQLVAPAVSAEPAIAVVSLVASNTSDHTAVTDSPPPLSSDSQTRLCTFQI